MFGIKKPVGKIKENINNGFSYLTVNISTWFGVFKDKLRWKSRLVLANRWARHNPKRFFAYFLISMISLITFNETIYFLVKKHNGENNRSSVLTVRPIFAGMNRINVNREGLKQQISELIDDGNQLLVVLDSLYNLPHKTRIDSIEIYRVMKQIETISNILDNETELKTD